LAEIEHAISIIGELSSAAPSDLPRVTGTPPWQYVLRRADLIDLFDTTPDLAGNQIDISRFVRLQNDADVYVAWRSWPQSREGEPPPDSVALADEELCAAPLGECRDFTNKKEPGCGILCSNGGSASRKCIRE
jgi:CRISPR-associated endonuclease/helicase Cas3